MIKKIIITVFSLGPILFVSTSVFALALSKQTFLEKNVAGVTCIQYFFFSDKVFKCDLDEEINPEQLYEALNVKPDEDVHCYNGTEPVDCLLSPSSTLIVTVSKKSLPGVDCSEHTKSSQASSSRFECKVKQKNINPEELYKALNVVATHRERCYKGAKPVECSVLH